MTGDAVVNIAQEFIKHRKKLDSEKFHQTFFKFIEDQTHRSQFYLSQDEVKKNKIYKNIFSILKDFREGL